MRNNKSILEEKYNLKIFGKTIICNKCNYSWEVSKLKYDRNMSCPNCHPSEHGSSRGECELYDLLLTTNLKIIHNDRTALSGKEIDIYFPDLKLGIEYDGAYWHDEKSDEIKNNLCKEKGITLLRVDAKLFTKDKETVLNEIKQYLPQGTEIHPENVTNVIRVTGKCRKIICTDTMEVFDNYFSLNKDWNVRDVLNVCNGRFSNYKGFHFEYYEEGKEYTQTQKGYNYKYKHVKCIETGEVFESLNQLMRFGVKTIFDCLSGKQKTAKKLHWEYTNEDVSFSDKTFKLIEESKNIKKEKPKKERKHKKVLCVETNQVFNSLKECAETFNAPNFEVISRVCRGERKTYKGYRFVYL